MLDNFSICFLPQFSFLPHLFLSYHIFLNTFMWFESLFIYYNCLKGVETETHTNTEITLSYADSLSICPQQLGLGWAKAKSLEVSLGLPCACRGSKYLGHYLVASKAGMIRKLESKVGLGLSVIYSEKGCGHPH